MKQFLMLLVFLFFMRPVMAELPVHDVVLQAEQTRIKVIQRASAATVAVFDANGEGGGSGVLISSDGYALSNFHVTAGSGVAMKCGLPDGKVYDAAIVGIDPVGDVALIQLLGRDDFPVAEIGDSDRVQVGDWAFVIGNPFLLADDFTPSVSYGMISGVQRYQYPAGTLLEYSDCLQTDAAINPGNSGGPLFDVSGKLIGINGRGSFEKRGRVNVGVGYAISINQINNFLSHLMGGRIVDHASLGATVSTEEDGRVVINDILESSDAYRRGLRYGDEIVQFAGRQITSANRLKNALGIFPPGWSVPLTYRREGETFDTFVRLMSLHDPNQLYTMIGQQEPRPLRPPEGEIPKPDDENEKKPKSIFPEFGRKKPKLPSAVAARYEQRRGYANYWYNLLKQENLWGHYREDDGQQLIGPSGGNLGWIIQGRLDGSNFDLQLYSQGAKLQSGRGKFEAKFTHDLERQLSPPRSGGLLLTLHLWHRMLEKGLRQYGEVSYLGQLPNGPAGELMDCLVGIYAGTEIRFLFSPENGELRGLEMFPDEQSDPCQIRFIRYGKMNGRRIPSHWLLQYGDEDPVEFEIETWEIGDES